MLGIGQICGADICMVYVLFILVQHDTDIVKRWETGICKNCKILILIYHIILS